MIRITPYIDRFYFDPVPSLSSDDYIEYEYPIHEGDEWKAINRITGKIVITGKFTKQPCREK